MGLPSILDVAIGLVFIFLILSLLASELQELLTTLLQWRARHLRDSIEVLLAGGVRTQQEEEVRILVHKLYDDPLIRNINQEAKGLAGKMRSMTRRLNQKGTFGTNQATGPSYISPETFATSLLEQMGLAGLSRKLVEIRLEKFATRIIGIYDNGQRVHQPVSIPSDQNERLVKELWSKGRIRLIAEKVGLKDENGNAQDLSKDASFQILAEEIDDILYDFETQECSLTTSVERMGESLNNYINSYVTTQPGEADAVRQARVAFVKRIESFKLSVFGEKNERAIASGGLRPSLLEIAELLDQTSTTYKEVNDSYQSLLKNGETLDQDMVPLLATMLLARHVTIVESQLIEQYPQQIAEAFKQLYPEVFTRFERQLQKIGQKIADPSLADNVVPIRNSAGLVSSADRPNTSKILQKPARKKSQVFDRQRNRIMHQWQKMRRTTPDELRRKQHKIMSSLFDGITPEESRDLLETILSRHTSSLEAIAPYPAPIDVPHLGQLDTSRPTPALCLFVEGALNRLNREDRSLLIDAALSDLSQQKGWNELIEKKQRSLYTDYQTYKTVKQVLDRLPISVKESFTILARRAQMRANKAENDVNRFREEVAVWFDRSMERATGVYKRNTKGVILLIGFSLAVLINVDTGFIADRLSNDGSLRRAVTERAGSVVPTGGILGANAADNTANMDLEAVRNDTKDALEELALPIGFSPENFSQQLDCPLPKNDTLPTNWETFYQQCLPPQADQLSRSAADAQTASIIGPKPEPTRFSAVGNFFGNLFGLIIHYPDRLLRICLGWLLSGLAISMGAPFWFDLLGKIVNVRNTGGKPASVEDHSTTQPAPSGKSSR